MRLFAIKKKPISEAKGIFMLRGITKHLMKRVKVSKETVVLRWWG